MDLAAGIRGRRVFIPGAPRGLGAHFARVLAGCGAAVAIGARRRERLDDLARELDAAGAETTVAVDLDVADESSVSRAL
ncbi:MAG: SDR family NAD(P)-dependent oxidoreductase, partial [Microvirga sp.]